jgi:hypothetical protein
MPAQFLTALGSIFIPVTAQLQRLYGLTAYLPTVLPTSKPAGVPDEIALVFYESQQAYLDTKKIVAGRAYSSLHSTVFAFPASLSDFPSLLGSTLSPDTPYHLFPGPIDWQAGYSQVFVGACPPGASPQFIQQLQRFFQSQQHKPPSGLDGAVFCVSARYVIYWEHWTSDGAANEGHISELAGIAQQVIQQPHRPQPVNPSLSDHYDGLADVESRSFNIIFPR